MTERLYFTDSYLAEFESEVTACAQAADRFEVSLAATAFYPTGGGQPNDLGVLGDRAVLDVIDGKDGGIVHVLDGALDQGARVKGRISWARRFDHMQQHSGQHILSAAFESICQAPTSSFHLGSESCTIDLGKFVSPDQIAASEDEANRIVWEDREVRLRFVEPDEAASLPLRKEPGREGLLRLIEVPGFDLSACGGTHVTRTGAVGLIGVLGWEKFKGGTRIEFVCGGRTLTRLRDWRNVFAGVSKVLSVTPSALTPAIERLQTENKNLSRTAKDLQSQIAVHVAEGLVREGARSHHGRLVISRAFEGWGAPALNALASAAAATSGVCVAAFSTTTPTLVVVARASDVELSAAAVVQALLSRFGGKGGGKPELAQGGGLTGGLDEMQEAARELLQA